MDRTYLDGIGEEIDANLDDSYLVLLLFVPITDLFFEISHFYSGGGDFD